MTIAFIRQASLFASVALLALSSLPSIVSTANAQETINLRTNQPTTARYGWKFGSAQHRDKLAMKFTGADYDMIFHARGWDIDSATEIKIAVNGKEIGFLPKSKRNNRFAPRMLFYIPKTQIRAGANILELIQEKPGYKWGVTDLGIYKAGSARSMFGNLKPLRKDTKHIGKVNLQIPQFDKGSRITVKYYDVDDVKEVEVIANGALIANAPVTGNNVWGQEITYDIPAGVKSIVIDNTYNGPKKYVWGVKIINVTATEPIVAGPTPKPEPKPVEPPAFDSLGLNIVSDTKWDETAVRQVLQTFAWGGRPFDSQVRKWANMAPGNAIVEMLNFDHHNLKLSPLSRRDNDRLDQVPNTLRKLSHFWSSNDPRNGVALKNRDSLKIGWNLHQLWSYAAMARGLNPFRHKIGLWETNYHMAVNMDTAVNAEQIVRYYDDIMWGHEEAKPYDSVISIAARSAAVATQYQHRRNRFKNGVCECNEDFAREYFQLFFGILGTGDSEYHESVTIKNMAHALTDMRVGWTPGGRLSDRVAFNSQYHYGQPLEIMHESIHGSLASERINALSRKAIGHWESQNTLPVKIVRDLADDNLTSNKIYQIRQAWKSMPNGNKNFLHFIRAYAISDLFHNTDRFKHWTTFDRHIIIANRFVHTNKEMYANVYAPFWLFTQEDVQVFRPKHNVFGGQTSIEAATNDRVFASGYKEASKGIWRFYSTSGTNDGISWNKDWGSIVPKASTNGWQVDKVAAWLWQHVIADGHANYSSLEKAHLIAFLGAERDLMQLLDPKALDRVITAQMIDTDPTIQALLATLGAKHLDLDHPTLEIRKKANANIGEAFAFITATPFNYAQRGR